MPYITAETAALLKEAAERIVDPSSTRASKEVQGQIAQRPLCIWLDSWVRPGLQAFLDEMGSK